MWGPLEEVHRRYSSFLGLARQGYYLCWRRGADICTERLISLLHPFHCPCSKSSSPQPLWHQRVCTATPDLEPETSMRRHRPVQTGDQGLWYLTCFPRLYP